LTVKDLSLDLERIGIHLSAPEIQVLGAMLKAANETQGEITFQQIHANITSERGKAPSKAWVYKCISNLGSTNASPILRVISSSQLIDSGNPGITQPQLKQSWRVLLILGADRRAY